MSLAGMPSVVCVCVRVCARVCLSACVRACVCIVFVCMYMRICMYACMHNMVDIHVYVGMDGWKEGVMLLVPEPDARGHGSESRCVSSALMRSQGVRAK